MKRTLALLLTGVMVLGLVGCSEKKVSTGEKTETEVVETTPEIEDETKEEVTVEENASDTEEDTNLLGVNQVVNGDFSDGVTNWGAYLSKGGNCEFFEQDGKGHFKIDRTGTENYAVQIFYEGFILEMGGVYEFSFDIDTDMARNLEARIQLNGGDYKAYLDQYVDVTPGEKHYSFQFTMEDGTDPAPRLCFNCGTPNGQEGLAEHTLIFDNVSLVLVDDSNVVRVEKVDNTRNVNVNQVGFLTNARKTFVVRDEKSDKAFDIKDESGKIVYSGTLTGPVLAEYAGENVLQGDFSDFKTPGKYTIVLANGDESYQFAIGDNVYDDLLKESFLMLTRARCGVEMPSDIAGEFAHPVCHNTMATIYGTNKQIDVSGGWHDAGDYGRYVVSGVQSVADLFLTYEEFPELWASDDMGIFESGNGVPDILDEARYELDWLLKMQDPSGGVYHKVTCKEFPGFVMPEEETEELIVSSISGTATADFAAIMAKASDVYKDIDPAFSKKALEASKKAWKWLVDNSGAPSFKNPEDILTGEYPDGNSRDERYWAAAELLKVTGEEEYKTYVENILDSLVFHGFGWASVGSFGNIAYLTMDESLQNPEYVEKIKADVNDRATELLENSKTDGYMCDLGSNYCWGSNLVVCSNAHQMLLAEEYTGNKAMGQAAHDQISYLLGQNTLTFCFVTGFGSNNAVNTHHRPSIFKGVTQKGMLVGGPDGNLEDSFTKSTMSDLPPAKVYVDNAQSYSTNEVTIYWNSPFIYLLSSEIANNK